MSARIPYGTLRHRDLDNIRDIVDFGVSADTRGYDRHSSWYRDRNMTPLMIAVFRGDVESAQFSIENGADVNARDVFDVTATHLAVDNNNFECLKLLLQAGADVSVPVKDAMNGYPFINGTTPLHLAATNGNLDCLKELLRCGADYNAVDEKDITALYFATQAGHVECVEALLDKAEGHRILCLPSLTTGDTPLHFAAQRGMVDAVKKLLESGADVNHKNAYGQTPLHACVALSVCKLEVSMQVLKLLVLHGPKIDLNIKDSFSYTPLHYATLEAFRRQPEMASFLIAYGANVDILDFNGLSLMQTECFSANSDQSVLEACAETFNNPPALSDNPIAGLTYITSSAEMKREFHRAWLACRRREPFVRNVSIKMVDRSHANAIKKHKWYNSLSSKPRSLKHTCRNAVRSVMGNRNLTAVKKLPLPNPLKSYLVFGAEIPSD